MLALKRTSGSNTAFIVQLSIVITPIIMAVLEKKAPARKTILPALMAMIGIYLITCSGKEFQINTGDIFALLNAICFSLFIALQNKYAQDVNAIQFTFVQHATSIIAFLSLSLIFESGTITFGNLVNPVFFVLIAINAVVIIFTSLFQSSAIKYVRPENAAIIYSLEPVTTALLGFLLIGERFAGAQAVIGCIIILTAVLITALKPKFIAKKRTSKLLFSNTRS
jgi:drug/metabolite transporter (DMT)-like permease